MWDHKRRRDFVAVSDRISKIAGAKTIASNRYSYSQYQMYKKSSHKYELKQRLKFLLRYSKNFEDFQKNAKALSVKIDFSGKHTTYLLTDRDMKRKIRANKMNRREVYDKNFFQAYFAKQEIQKRLEFLMKYSNSINDLVKKAELLNLCVNVRAKKIDFTLQTDGGEVTINSEKLSKKYNYDIAYFEDYFSKRGFKNEQLRSYEEVLQEYQTFEKRMDYSIPTEDFLERYNQEKSQEVETALFEVELEEWQLEKEVNDGIYIKVWFGLDSEGIVFIPDSHLEIETTSSLEKNYRVFIDEKKYYYLYNKDHSEANRFIMGKTMIKQLSGERQKVPHRKFVTEKTLKEKMNQINLLLQLNVKERSYSEIKEELIAQIVHRELKMTALTQKIETLNRVAELLAGCDSEDLDIKRRSRLELSKLNVSIHLTDAQIDEQLRELQNELCNAVSDYESVIRQMDVYIDLLKKYNTDDTAKVHQKGDQAIEI